MKAFASDFDGTLFFHNRPEPINHSDISAIWDFQNQGHLFGFCTGRPLFGTLDYIREHVKADFYITNSGATIHDSRLQLIYEKTIPHDIIEKLISYGSRNSYSIDLHMDGKFYAFEKPTSFINEVLESLDDMNGNVHNISYDAHTAENAGRLVKQISLQFGEQVSAFQNVQYVDIVPYGCSKGKGIEFIRNYLKIDIFAGIGDSMNDLPMLEKVDVPFTFVDAPEKLKENATHLVNSVADAVHFML